MWSAGLLEPLPTAEWLVWTQSASSEHPVSGSPQSCAGSTTQNQQPVPGKAIHTNSEKTVA